MKRTTNTMTTLNDNHNAFPLERLFPGIHAARPDIAAHEAEMFLEHGAENKGFDLDDLEERQWLLEGPGEFISFFIRTLPAAIAERVAKLPADWQERPEFNDEADAINTAIEDHYGLRPRFYVSINERGEAWVAIDLHSK